MPIAKLRTFSPDEVSRATEHLKQRAPEVFRMMEKNELGELRNITQFEWTKTMFGIAPILDELGITESLSQNSALTFRIRQEIRRRLGLAV